MEKRNVEKFNVLKKNLMPFAEPENVWTFGETYFMATEAEEYREMTKEELCELLVSASTLQKDNGLVYMYEDSTMPHDAKVGIVYKPSYAIAAIAIYACRKCPEIFNDELTRFLEKLLEDGFSNGIVGHGIESSETVRRTMYMLCRAGLKSFLEEEKEHYPCFADKMYYYMDSFKMLAKRIDEEGVVVTANGFSSDSINHLIKELVAYWDGNTRPVFVYGTLMKGERANRMLSKGEYAGFFQLKDYAMYNLGAYPGIKPCAGESVLGELYFVNSETIAQLDEYEGEGSLYKRETVQLVAGFNKISAEAYIYNRDVAGCRKMREEWNGRDDDLVWYAGYGSNLSSDRFACYISGGMCAENGRVYSGSSEPVPPRAEKKCTYRGKLYFGNNSPSWGGGGVAFFDPEPKNKDARVYMKCYLITRRQLHDVMRQEGESPNWYGRLVCLEIDSMGIPVYTLTSETKRPKNAPSPAYTELIATVLKKEFKLGKKAITGYLSCGLE